MQDKEVVIERNADYWAGAPKIARVRFEVVPDTITTALMMKKKGVADLESNVLTLDMANCAGAGQAGVEDRDGAEVDGGVHELQRDRPAAARPGRVRQAIAYAIDRPEMVDSLWRGQAADGGDALLPAGTHWALAPAIREVRSRRITMTRRGRSEAIAG